MSILKTQRELFDIPDDIAYFNCSYNSPLLKESTSRLHNGVDSKSHPWERIPSDFFDEYYDGRDLAFAIEVDNPVLYDEPINPREEYINFTAPQSYMYL